MVLKVELLRNDGTVLFKGTFDALKPVQWVTGPGEYLYIPENQVKFLGFSYHPAYATGANFEEVKFPSDL